MHIRETGALATVLCGMLYIQVPASVQRPLFGFRPDRLWIGAEGAKIDASQTIPGAKGANSIGFTVFPDFIPKEVNLV